jgi:hypothetical protein
MSIPEPHPAFPNYFITQVDDMPIKGQTGDWRTKYGEKRITVAEGMSIDHCLATAIHEMVEQRLCEKRGIKEIDVDCYDMRDGDPYKRECPYRKEHVAAMKVERAVCKVLGIAPLPE